MTASKITPESVKPKLRFQKFALTDAQVAAVLKLGMKPVRLLTNDGSATIMEGDGDDSRPVIRVLCQTSYKRGEGHKSECVERDELAAFIVKSANLHDELVAVMTQIDDMIGAHGKLDASNETLKFWQGLIRAALSKAGA